LKILLFEHLWEILVFRMSLLCLEIGSFSRSICQWNGGSKGFKLFQVSNHNIFYNKVGAKELMGNKNPRHITSLWHPKTFFLMMMMKRISLIMKTHCSTTCKFGQKEPKHKDAQPMSRLQRITLIVEVVVYLGSLKMELANQKMAC
jgi:hypothetical protein